MVLALLALGHLAACGGERTVTRTTAWIDPVHRVGAGLSSSKPEDVELDGGAVWTFANCHERRRLAIRLPVGAELVVPLSEIRGQGTEATLRLSGCSEGIGAPELQLTVEPSGLGEPAAPITVTVPGADWWPRRSIGLGPPREDASVRITLQGHEAASVVLQDVFVEVRSTVPEARDGQLLVLVSLDTLRDDVLDRPCTSECATPNLDRLRRSAQRFTPHYASASWTKPSHAGLLSGMLASGHGASGVQEAISTPRPLLAESLGEGGFHTTAVVEDVVWLDQKFGFDRGFDRYVVARWGAEQKIRSLLDDLVEHRGRDRFAFLHTFEPHSDFYILPYEGIGARRSIVAERFGVEQYGCRDDECAANLLVGMRDGDIEPLEGEGEILHYLYDAGVRELDRAIGDLIDGLQAAGLWDDALVVVTSDHGEALLEHGRVEHGRNWESVLRVPLLIKWPGGEHAGTIVTEPTSALDIAPTLLTAAGLDVPGHLLGHPLQAFREGAPERSAPVFSGSDRRVVWRDGFKLTFGHAGELELHDLAADPDELTNLATALPDRARDLAALLERRFLAERSLGRPGEKATELNAAERERLEALGYL